MKRPRNLHMIKRIEPFKSGISTLNGKNTFPWVIYNDGKMFCSTCLDFPEEISDASSFISGCSNFRMESLKSQAN